LEESKVADETKDSENLHKAERPPVEINADIDESKLSDSEKQMLADLQTSQAVEKADGVFPASLATSEEELVRIPEKPESIVLTAEENLPEEAPEEETEEAPEEETEEAPEEETEEAPEEETEEESTALPPLLDENEPEFGESPQSSEPLAEGTGAAAQQTQCPHCSWDLSMPSIQEPSYNEKMGFLHSVLGQKTFINQYEMFGGKVLARFRTLTTKEMDVVYQQVFSEREAGIVTTIQDYWEKVNRYRLYLQLVYLAATDGSFTYQLPEGYSDKVNPHAASFYEFEPTDPDGTFLPEIENYILEEVLRTESIQRTVNTLCARFNRLISKLEAMIDNSDFWEATEEQS
jgi:hypothetical protein